MVFETFQPLKIVSFTCSEPNLHYDIQLISVVLLLKLVVETPSMYTEKKSTIPLYFNPRPFPQTYRCFCRVLKWVSCQACASMGTWKAQELLLLAESRLHLTLKSSKLTAWLIAASFSKSSCYGEPGFSGWLSNSSCRDSGGGCSFLPSGKGIMLEGLSQGLSCELCFNQWGSVVTCSILNWSSFLFSSRKLNSRPPAETILTRTLLFNNVVGFILRKLKS